MSETPFPLPHWMTRRSTDVVALGLLALAVLWLVWGPLVNGHALYFRDLQVFFIPLKQFLADALARGELPFWNPGVSMGTPYFAEMQTAVLYPASWLLLLADGNHGIGLLLAFHLLLAAAGAYGLTRSMGLAAPAALASAAVFSLGGCMLSSVNMINFMQALAWLPWVLWAFERDARTPGPCSWVLAALAVGLQTLAGAPDVSIMTGLVVVGRQIMLAQGGLRVRLAWLPRVAAAYLAALLLASPQLLATYELYSQSVRTVGLSTEEIQSYSLRFGELLSLILPPALSREDWRIAEVYSGGYVPLFLSLYIGWVAIAFSLFALWARRGPALFWLALGGVGVFLALGGNNPAAMWVYETIAIFRYPEKYVVLLHVGLVMLVGLGVDAWLRKYARQPRWLLAAVLAVLVMMVDLVGFNGEINLEAPGDYYTLDDIPETRWLGQEGAGFVYTRPDYRDQPDRVREVYREYRRQLSPHIGTLAGVRYAQGTEGLVIRDHALISGLLDSLPPNGQFLQHLAFLNVRYIMTDMSLFQRSRWLKQSARQLTPRLWDVGQPRPMLYFPRVVLNRDSDYLQIASKERAMIVGQSAFALTPSGSDEAGLHGRVLSSERLSPNRMAVRVQVEGRGLLVWNESYYPGWRAYVDGEKQTVVRANHLFNGVWLEDGEHELVFEFVPNNFYFGLGLMAITLMLLAIVYFNTRPSVLKNLWERFQPRSSVRR
ncbi:MAG: YfhO family protein [Gammaproteobacteria bacterium]|nr:YfhO family protein [Gammaproteobacteria bacterium]MCF6363173.1 YfhO family protein [Gammaproteobacteria bacterium]